MKIIDKTEFDQIKNDGVLLVDFFANWCGPCKMVAPILEELSKEYDGKVNMVKIDVDQEPSLSGSFGVMSIPTIIIFKNGEIAKQITGFQPKPQLQQAIEEVL